MGVFLRSEGREFHTPGAENEKERRPDTRLLFGITKTLSEEERRVRDGW